MEAKAYAWVWVRLLVLLLAAFGVFGLWSGCNAVLLADLSRALGLSPGPLGVALFAGAASSIAAMARSSPRRGAREGSRKVDGRRHGGEQQVPDRGGALEDRVLGSVVGPLRAARRPLFSACWQRRQPAEPYVL